MAESSRVVATCEVSTNYCVLQTTGLSLALNIWQHLLQGDKLALSLSGDTSHQLSTWHVYSEPSSEKQSTRRVACMRPDRASCQARLGRVCTRYGASAVELLLSADCRTGQRITCSGCCVDGRTEDEQPRTPTEPPRRSTLKQVKFACQGCSSRVRCCVFECRASSSTAHRWQASAQIAASQLNAF